MIDPLHEADDEKALQQEDDLPEEALLPLAGVDIWISRATSKQWAGVEDK